jgi:hypothetical protein
MPRLGYDATCSICEETLTFKCGISPGSSRGEPRISLDLLSNASLDSRGRVETPGAAGKFVQAELLARCAGRPVCHFAEPAFDGLDFDLGHDAHPWSGSTTLSVTDDCRARGGDGTTLELWAPIRCAKKLTRGNLFGKHLTRPSVGSLTRRLRQLIIQFSHPFCGLGHRQVGHHRAMPRAGLLR